MRERKFSSIIFYTDDKHILLQDRKGISKRGEEWAFFGGKLEDGETKEDALIREVKEELDYDIGSTYKFVKEFIFEYPPSDLMVTQYVFIAPLGDNLKHFTVKEGNGMKLYTLAEAKTLKMFPGDSQILELLEKTL
jgi:8-oxo-dGTP diphosphatase